MPQYSSSARPLPRTRRRYQQPGELSVLETFGAMRNSQPEAQRATFDRVCSRFSPKLHHFFLEVGCRGGVLCAATP